MVVNGVLAFADAYKNSSFEWWVSRACDEKSGNRERPGTLAPATRKISELRVAGSIILNSRNDPIRITAKLRYISLGPFEEELFC